MEYDNHQYDRNSEYRNRLQDVIEEILTVYHEPFFARWAVRALVGEKADAVGSHALNAVITTPVSEEQEYGAEAARACLLAYFALGLDAKLDYLDQAMEAALNQQDVNNYWNNVATLDDKK